MGDPGCLGYAQGLVEGDSVNYHLVSILAWFLMGVALHKSTPINTFCKLACYSLAFWGAWDFFK